MGQTLYITSLQSGWGARGEAVPLSLWIPLGTDVCPYEERAPVGADMCVCLRARRVSSVMGYIDFKVVS